MKLSERIAIVAIAAAILSTTAVIWLLFYSGDLPGLDAIGKFAPTTAGVATDGCLAPNGIPVVPYPALGVNVRNATGAAERHIELQVARSLLCDYHGKNLPRILLEYKTSLILKRRFTPEQLLTIYLNRAYYGTGVIGVEAVSERYYRTRPDRLTVPQAAMIIGLIRSPGYYSPERHPDRCKKRRDEIVDAMLGHGDVTSKEAITAKEAPLI